MRKSDTNIGPTTGPPRVLSIGYVPILRHQKHPISMWQIIFIIYNQTNIVWLTYEILN